MLSRHCFLRLRTSYSVQTLHTAVMLETFHFWLSFRDLTSYAWHPVALVSVAKDISWEWRPRVMSLVINQATAKRNFILEDGITSLLGSFLCYLPVIACCVAVCWTGRSWPLVKAVDLHHWQNTWSCCHHMWKHHRRAIGQRLPLHTYGLVESHVSFWAVDELLSH